MDLKDLRADPETLLRELAALTDKCVGGFVAERPGPEGPMPYLAVEHGTAVSAIKLRYQIAKDQTQARALDTQPVRPFVEYGRD